MQRAFGKKKVLLLFLLPALLMYTAFVIVSIVWAGYYSFFDWSGVGEKLFVGLNNYVELITKDRVFHATVWHTVVYTVINVMIQVFGGLLFARKNRGFYFGYPGKNVGKSHCIRYGRYFSV